MNTSELVLVRPTKAMEQEITEYKEEHFGAGDMQVHGSGGLAYFDSFDEWLKHIEAISEVNPAEFGLTSIRNAVIRFLQQYKIR